MAEGKSRIAKVDLCDDVARAMLGDQGYFAEPFPHRFHTIEPNPGVHILLEEVEDSVVRPVPRGYVAAKIVAWVAKMAAVQRMPELRVTYNVAVEVVEYWRSLARPLPDGGIAQLSWQGEPGLTWHRLPWGRGAGGEFPTWHSIIARMSNAGAFVAWVGSLFDPASSLHQYVWCHGQGHDGKGAINRFFERVFGRCYRSKQPPARGDKFWSFGLIGARLVVMPDCDNTRFVTSGSFRSLTGGDPIDVEAKGQMSGTVRVHCKFLVLSNEKPAVGSIEADQRRIIYCEFTAKGAYDPGFENRLWDEGGAFLEACIATYGAKYPGHGAIDTDRAQIDDIAAAEESEFDAVFETNFMRTGPLPKGPHSDHVIRGHTVGNEAMRLVLVQAFREPAKRREFLAWCARVHGVKNTAVRVAVTGLPHGKVTRKWVNLAQKPDSLIFDARYSGVTQVAKVTDIASKRQYD